MALRRAISRLERDPAVAAGALTGVCVWWLEGRGRGRRAGRTDGPLAVLRSALLGAAIGGVARRWTWSAVRVEEELIDAELVLQAGGGAGVAA